MALDSQFFTAQEAAAVLRVTPMAVTKMCRQGKLPATKPAGTWLIDRADLEAFIAAGYNQAATA